MTMKQPVEPEDNRVWATVNVVVIKRGRVLLMRRENTGWMNGHLGLPGGHALPDESPSRAAAREVNEELGLDLASARFNFLCVYPRFDAVAGEREKVAYEFVVELSDDEVPTNAEPHRCAELIWCDPKQLPDDTIAEFRQVIVRGLLGNERYFEVGYEA